MEPGYRVPRADGELEPQRAAGGAARAAGPRLRVRGPRDRHERAWLLVVDGNVTLTTADGNNVSGGAGLLAIFDPKERHEVEAVEDSRLLLVLSPWPGDGHPSQQNSGE